jgi:hypothetical protein
MSKLIGTNPNQVPSNADLGTAAFMDKKDFLLSKGSSLSAINAVIPKTAVDVFIYDTSKDSDGGAWRKRTQHTSWYNEKLNTTTRGSRKEFPAVAVIVMEYASAAGSSAMTIYDGDDPTLPMWMSCQVDSNNRWIRYNGTIRSVAALNGIILAGANGADITDSLLSRMDLICDKLERHFDGGVHQIDNRGIVHRNSNFKITSTGTQNIVNRYVNDVAMTVLPNAPIDADTGLPAPTIAVATEGGVSVIKDDGTVVDITVNNASYTIARRVNFLSDNSLGMGIGVSNGVAQESYYIFNNIPTSDNVITVDNIAGTTQNVDEFYAIQPPNSLVDLQLLGLNTNRALRSSTGNSFASDEGLSVISRNVGSPEKGSVAYIASDYNTGWMPGDIKLATLSDTDTTNAVGTELITNGTFDSNITGWSAGAGAVLSHSSSGIANASTAYNSYAYIDFTLTAGKQYIFRADITSDSQGSGGAPRIAVTETASDSTFLGSTATSGVGSYSVTFTATGATRVRLIKGSNSGTTIYDNVSLRLAEPDRSYNNNGLQVFGTVTKTAVATGAELVAYSGFSSSNGLVLPYSSFIDPGTGDYSVIFWMKCSATTSEQTIARRFGIPTVTGGFLMRLVSSTSTLQWYTRDTSSNVAQITTTQALDDGSWKQIIGTREGGRMKLYINGVLQGDVATSASSHNAGTTAPLNIGVEGSGSFANPATATSLALFRYSLSAPSSEQIKKMYNDEKHLFQENAKATLYGTSDTVTALAYDDDTELLHVGTSAGRSVFQGLNRVDNTTDAVGTSISASNGFIVED